MTRLWLIRVKWLGNAALFEDGWRAGDWVRSVRHPMHLKFTFDKCLLGETTPYDSLEGVEWAIKEKSPYFSRVEFEAVEFRSVT